MILKRVVFDIKRIGECVTMYDVFISYRRKKGFAVAKMICELLKAKGVNTFIDLDELTSGTFDDKILDAIESTPAFILVLTPGALDRCVDEGDWLTKEINTAVETGRNIIPVMCDGFEWPEVWAEGTPDNIKVLSHYNGIVMRYEYVDAMVSKIIEYSKCKTAMVAEPLVTKSTVNNDIEDFFKVCMSDLDEVTGVDFAFHAGSIWHQDIERIETLGLLADSGKRIRVIVNTPDIADSTSKYMRHKLKKYLAFDEAIKLWNNIADMYENVEIRISDTPLMRIYYSFSMKNPELNKTRIKFYTHGNSRIDLNYCCDFSASEDAYKLFKSEFEFLWDNAKK